MGVPNITQTPNYFETNGIANCSQCRAQCSINFDGPNYLVRCDRCNYSHGYAMVTRAEAISEHNACTQDSIRRQTVMPVAEPSSYLRASGAQQFDDETTCFAAQPAKWHATRFDAAVRKAG